MNALRIAITSSVFVAAASLALPDLHAHTGSHAHSKRAAQMVETDFGRTGDPKKVSRTVTVDMADTMRFTPAEFSVKQGDTIRFVVRNRGKTMHEMVFGTKKDLAEHAEAMKKHPNMEHDEPYMAHVAPGKQEAIVWQFTKPGEFFYGCLVPGHFDAGMVGRLIVKP